MTLVKFHRNENRFPVFSNLWDNFLRDDDFGFRSYSSSVPAVNVVENKDSFRIEVAAPGLSKEDFKIKMEDNLLTISSEKEVKNHEDSERFTRREFCYTSFNRSFTIPETIDQQKIDAKYVDGVLNINLPKKEEAKVQPSREINIA